MTTGLIMKQKTVAIAGATGLVGSHLLTGLLSDPRIEKIYALCRTPLPISHEKLTSIPVDFDALATLPPIDEVYLALGTTIKVAGSKEAFSKVDFTYTLAVVKAAIKAGAKKIGVVSSIGANTHSKSFYSQVKGQLENALKALKPEGLVIVRPSLLLGNRKSLGQPTRRGEEIFIVIAKLLNFFLPKRFRAIEATKVANALRLEVPETTGVIMIDSAHLQQY